MFFRNVLWPFLKPRTNMNTDNIMSAELMLLDDLGIYPYYFSNEGKKIILSWEDQKSLLRAMGVNVKEGSIPEQILAEYRSAVQPVYDGKASSLFGKAAVVPAEKPVLFLRGNSAGGPEFPVSLRINVTLESGERKSVLLTLSKTEFTSVTPEGLRNREVSAYIPDTGFPEGYHHFFLEGESEADPEDAVSLIAVPAECWTDPAAEQEALTGVWVQLYAVRSERNAGVGDFGDIPELCRILSEKGISVLGVNPIHSLFPSDPSLISPYYPSSRYFKNWLYIAPDLIPEWKHADTESLKKPDDSGDRIDYLNTAVYKEKLLRRIYNVFQNHPESEKRRRDYAHWKSQAPLRLQLHSLYEALYEEYGKGPSHWKEEDYRIPKMHPSSDEFRNSVKKHSEKADYYLFLQWTASQQLEAVSREAAGYGVKIYLDLAVGASPDGSEVWCDPGSFIRGAHIGAPPDGFAPKGQNWGLAPMNPLSLRENRFRPVTDLFRANMVPGGMLRIDHVMGLFRLYWSLGESGGYVQYPYKEMFGILALESRRNRCMIIGEDLGTVPDEVRSELLRRKIFSWKVLYFERNGSGFRSETEYGDYSVATVNTHDLPTMTGWWNGLDIGLRHSLGFWDQAETERNMNWRREEKRILADFLKWKGLLSPDFNPESGDAEEVIRAAHSFIKRTSSRIKLLSLYDIFSDPNQPNVPGTTDQYPNWALRYPVSLEQLREDKSLLEKI